MISNDQCFHVGCINKPVTTVQHGGKEVRTCYEHYREAELLVYEATQIGTGTTIGPWSLTIYTSEVNR